jgi:hypothetical protein
MCFLELMSLCHVCQVMLSLNCACMIPHPLTVLNANPTRLLTKWQQALAACRRWDRLAGVGGILPSGIRHLLCPSASTLGIRERDRERHYKDQTYAMDNLTLAILRGDKVVYERWWGRQATASSSSPWCPHLAWRVSTMAPKSWLSAAGAWTCEQISRT